MTDAPQVVVTLTGAIAGHRQLVFQAGLSPGTTLQEMNEFLDKCRVALERQSAFAEREQLKLELEQQEKIAEDHVRRLAQVEEHVSRDWEHRGKRGDIRLNGNQAREKQQAYANIEESKKRIAIVKHQIAECEARMAG